MKLEAFQDVNRLFLDSGLNFQMPYRLLLLFLLIDIIVITLLTVICGADGLVGVATFGQAKYPWLKTILELPNGPC